MKEMALKQEDALAKMGAKQSSHIPRFLPNGRSRGSANALVNATIAYGDQLIRKLTTMNIPDS